MANKLTQTSCEYIINFIDLITALKLDLAVLDQTVVSARNENATLVVIEPDNLLIDDAFDSFGLTRLNDLKNKMKIDNNGDVNISVDLDEDDSVRDIIIKSNKTTVKHRTTRAKHIRTPKKVNDEFSCTFNISKEDIQLIINAHRALPQVKGRSYITFIGDGKTVEAQITDLNSDLYTHHIDETTHHFAYRYDIDSFLTLIRACKEGGEFSVGDTRGFLRTEIKGFACYLPQIV